jgi:hypothetical protein
VQTWSLLPAGGGKERKKKEKRKEEEDEKGWVALASCLKIETTGPKASRQATSFFWLLFYYKAQIPAGSKDW